MGGVRDQQEGPRAGRQVPAPYRESMVTHGLDHISEEDLGGEGVPVIDDGFPALSLPAVKFHTAASLGKGPAVDRQMDGQSVGMPLPQGGGRLGQEMQSGAPCSHPPQHHGT